MKSVIPLIILALVVAGFAYYTLFTEPNIDLDPETVRPAPTQSEADASATTERESFTGAGTLYSLLTRGDNLECAITYIPNPLEPEITGNIFTHEGRFRGDFVVPTPDLSGQTVTSIIIADDTVWQWTDLDGEVVGSTQPTDFTPSGLDRLVAPIGFNAEVQYDCLTWPQVDYTIFEAPTNVLFSDAQDATFEEGVIFEDPEPEF